MSPGLRLLVNGKPKRWSPAELTALAAEKRAENDALDRFVARADEIEGRESGRGVAAPGKRTGLRVSENLRLRALRGQPIAAGTSAEPSGGSGKAWEGRGNLPARNAEEPGGESGRSLSVPSIAVEFVQGMVLLGICVLLYVGAFYGAEAVQAWYADLVVTPRLLLGGALSITVGLLALIGLGAKVRDGKAGTVPKRGWE